MSCPKQSYKILGLFKSFRPHDWQTKEVGVFMRGVSESFTVRYECPHCGLTKKESFIQAEELMKQGYTLEQLEEFKHKELA